MGKTKLLKTHLKNIMTPESQYKPKNDMICNKTKAFHKKKNIEINDDVIPHVKSNMTIYYTPEQLITLYGLKYDDGTNKIPEQRGLGITVAVIIAYHYSGLQRDFDKYNKQYKLPTQKLKIKSFTNRTNLGWAGECCLDVQTIHTIAPYAQIMVVEAATNSYNDLMIAIKYAVNNGATVVSMSWGGNENNNVINTYDNYFKTTENVCFVCSSGDENNIVNFPSTSANVISVGGTTVTSFPNGLRKSEIPWYSGNGSGSGDGYSSIISKPLYQTNITTITNSKRATPDISLIADPKTGFIVCNGGSYYIYGGTSLACPVMAGFLAIGNQIRKKNNKSYLTTNTMNINNVQHFLYQTIYNNNSDNINYNNSEIYKSCCYDIINGINGIYRTSPGYDLASGLGSLNANIFCNILNNI